MDVLAKEKRKRDKRINFWLTESEYNDIKSRADKYDLSISEYIRTLALNADINMSLDHVKTSSVDGDILDDSQVEEASENDIEIAEDVAVEAIEATEEMVDDEEDQLVASVEEFLKNAAK